MLVIQDSLFHFCIDPLPGAVFYAADISIPYITVSQY